jgi:hypothetical protein
MTRFLRPGRGKAVNTSLLKRVGVALWGAALLLSASISFSQAQSTTPASASGKQHLEAVIDLAASKLGLTSDQLSAALKEARKDLGANQGAWRFARLVHHELSVAAAALGISDVKTLRKELAGTTLTAVAQKHGVQPSTVAAALKADLDARIQALVTAARIKPDRAAASKVRAEARVDAFMTHQFKAARAAP